MPVWTKLKNDVSIACCTRHATTVHFLYKRDPHVLSVCVAQLIVKSMAVLSYMSSSWPASLFAWCAQ